MKLLRRKALAAVCGLCAVLMVRSALGQGTTDPQGMLQIFADASVNWQTVIFPFALNLFKLLAGVDFAWTCISLALEKSDVQALTAGIIKKLMTIGIFYTLLIFAPKWFPAIIQSFVQIGGAASGTATPLNPSDILSMGATISGSLLSAAASTTSLLTGFSTSLALILAAAVIIVSYVVITVHFVMAMVESYVVIGAGYIFLGFGGSRWTSPYAEKYVSQVVSVGSRLMVLYLVIGLGQQFATQWIAASQVAANGAAANLSLSWNLACQVAIYAVICWTVPKLVSNVIGGTLSASAGDAIGVGVAAATAALSGAAMMSGIGAPAAAGGGSSAVSSVASAAGAANTAGTISGGTAGGGSAMSPTAGAASVGSTASGASVPGTSPGNAARLTGNGSSGGMSGSGSSSQPAPPASALAASRNGGGTSPGASSRSVSPSRSAGPTSPSGTGSSKRTMSASNSGSGVATQPPPPAKELAQARASLNQAKELIQSVHGHLPSDGAVSSGANLNIGHQSE